MKEMKCLPMEKMLKGGDKYFFVAGADRTVDIYIGEKGWYKVYGEADVSSINGTNHYVVHACEKPSREVVESIMYDMFPHVWDSIMRQMPF